MDVGELLSFKPDRSSKRPYEEDCSELGQDKPPPAKVPRGRDATLNSVVGAGLSNLNGVSDEEKLRLLQSLDDDDTSAELGDVLDAGGVKRMLLSFEKKVLKNQEMRIKFPDLPEKFMESELELNDEIQKLHVIATVPEHYQVLIETNAIQTLVGLLSHDNSDVAIGIIDLLQELTDVDTLNESEEEAERLIEGLLGEQVHCTLCVISSSINYGTGYDCIPTW